MSKKKNFGKSYEHVKLIEIKDKTINRDSIRSKISDWEMCFVINKNFFRSYIFKVISKVV